MSNDGRKVIRAARLAAILILAGISIAFIAHSVFAVSFSVGGKRLNELAVTELSLTHSVQRGPDGKLFNPYETTDESQVAQPDAGQSRFVVYRPKSTDLEELAAKKAPPKSKAKPALKKPAPKPKPKPKTPAPKRKGAGKACPT